MIHTPNINPFTAYTKSAFWLWLNKYIHKGASRLMGGGGGGGSDGGLHFLSGGCAPWGALFLMGGFLKIIIGWGGGGSRSMSNLTLCPLFINMVQLYHECRNIELKIFQQNNRHDTYLQISMDNSVSMTILHSWENLPKMSPCFWFWELAMFVNMC